MIKFRLNSVLIRTVAALVYHWFVFVEVLETALQSGLSSSYDFLSVWSVYCDVIRRQIDWTDSQSPLITKLRELFERAIQHLLQCMYCAWSPGYVR